MKPRLAQCCEKSPIQLCSLKLHLVGENWEIFHIHSFVAKYLIISQAHMNVAKKLFLNTFDYEPDSWKIFRRKVLTVSVRTSFMPLKSTGRVEGKKSIFSRQSTIFSGVQARCHFYSYRSLVDFTEKRVMKNRHLGRLVNIHFSLTKLNQS